MNDVIPKKDKKGGKGGQKGNQPRNPQNGDKKPTCEHCAKWACPIMHIYTANNCKRFDANGNDLKKCSGRFQRDHKELKHNFITIQKETENLNKKLKKSK